MSKTNSPIKAEDLPYRPCVGIMVLNREGLVWAGKRIPIGNSEYDGSPQLWQMPQGGIDAGEDPLEAAYRELYEETGMKTVTSARRGKRLDQLRSAAATDWYRPQGEIPRPDPTLVRLPLRWRRERNRHQSAARRPRAGIRRLGMEADGGVARPDRRLQAPGLRPSGG